MKNYKKIKNIILASSLLLSAQAYSQVGINTETPRGALDIKGENMGLVLPSNISPRQVINPQGGSLAEGTIIYDTAMRCIKYYDGNAWSECLTDSDDEVPNTKITTDCASNGFEGSYITGTPLSDAKFSVSITNNSLETVGPLTFQPSDLELTGVNGIIVDSASPTSVSINPGETKRITYSLSGTPSTEGILTGTWSRLRLNCSNSIPVNDGSRKGGVRFASVNYFSIGRKTQAVFNSQLTNPSNYGQTGTYNKVDGFAFSDITEHLSDMTTADLQNRYDVVCIGIQQVSVENAAKIKEFVDGGGVAIILMDETQGTTLLQAFGGNGSVSKGTIEATTNTNTLNNGVFGTGTNVSLLGQGTYGEVTQSQLPPDATVLAEGVDNSAKVFITGAGGRAIFFWDEGVLRNSSNVNGDTIDTQQEIFLHNIMAYALDKAGF